MYLAELVMKDKKAGKDLMRHFFEALAAEMELRGGRASNEQGITFVENR